MPRKKRQERKPWQRRAKGSSQFNPLYNDLLDSPAFHSLSKGAKVLYLYALRESHGEAMRDDGKRKGTEGDSRLFYMNRALRTHVHKLYSPSDSRAFERDMSELIRAGFIDCLESGLQERKKSLYRLSSRWCDFGTPAFSMPERFKTTHMLIEEAKAERARLRAESAATQTAKPMANVYVSPAPEQDVSAQNGENLTATEQDVLPKPQQT